MNKVKHQDNCEDCGGTYECSKCGSRCGYCFGLADDMPDDCDDCWIAAHVAGAKFTSERV